MAKNSKQGPKQVSNNGAVCDEGHVRKNKHPSKKVFCAQRDGEHAVAVISKSLQLFKSEKFCFQSDLICTCEKIGF